MTAKEFNDKLSIFACVRGTVIYNINYRGKWIECRSHDTLAYDTIRSGENSSFYTVKQAMQALYNEGKPTKQRRIYNKLIDLN